MIRIHRSIQIHCSCYASCLILHFDPRNSSDFSHVDTRHWLVRHNLWSSDRNYNRVRKSFEDVCQWYACDLQPMLEYFEHDHLTMHYVVLRSWKIDEWGTLINDQWLVFLHERMRVRYDDELDRIYVWGPDRRDRSMDHRVRDIPRRTQSSFDDDNDEIISFKHWPYSLLLWSTFFSLYSYRSVVDFDLLQQLTRCHFVVVVYSTGIVRNDVLLFEIILLLLT